MIVLGLVLLKGALAVVTVVLQRRRAPARWRLAVLAVLVVVACLSFIGAVAAHSVAGYVMAVIDVVLVGACAALALYIIAVARLERR